MIRKRYILPAIPLAIHVFLGVVLLIISSVYGINDQDFSFAVALAFYYFNWPAWQFLNWAGIEFSILRLLLAGLPVWVVLGFLIWAVGLLFRRRQVIDPIMMCVHKLFPSN